MPVTTYMHDPPEGPPEHSDRVAELWCDYQAATEQEYAVEERKIRTERWLMTTSFSTDTSCMCISKARSGRRWAV